ncbi:permease [Paenibacillus sp. GSMTC-2017]|uniref:permease n=1 Tax=Paenibacillus sp. GSMTC-2017 TaxID=2794350 RepID=UPI0018D9772D|nr:permease [Paenibacillus sp. GSMTC-2017]MBH5319184.1 permease [Paenibacillus sp. GSMTC-2017]
MRQMIFRFGTPALATGCLIMLALIATNRELPSALTSLFETANLQSFKILFISIILEAFPFILLGVLFSAVLQVFVTDAMIRKFTPRNRIAGVLFGGLLGIVFPLCECGMIPVIRRLIRKGMPSYIGIVYLLAGPIVNPIVYTSTFTAFRTTPEMAYYRMGLAFVVAIIIGFIFAKFVKSSPLRGDNQPIHLTGVSAASQAPFHMISTQPIEPKGNKVRGRTSATLAHASDEFFEMGKYLIFGAFLTAIIQTAIDRSTLVSFADQPLFSYFFMMIFAFILSICSTSDAFIASSFSGIFQQGPLLAFLVFGPMIDFKNTLMMLSTFKVKIVLILIALTAVLTLTGALLVGVLL